MTAIGPSDLTLESGETVPADVVVAAVGVRPDTTLAAEAGLAIGERGGILVDDHLRTSDPAVLAVGDAVVVTSGGRVRDDRPPPQDRVGLVSGAPKVFTTSANAQAPAP